MKYIGADFQNPIGITGHTDSSIPNKTELVLSVDGVTKSDPITTQDVELTQFIGIDTYNAYLQTPALMTAGVRYVLDESTINSYIPLGRNADYTLNNEIRLAKQDGTSLKWINGNIMYEQSFSLNYSSGDTLVATISGLDKVVRSDVVSNAGVVSPLYIVSASGSNIMITGTGAGDLYVTVQYTKS